MVAHWSPVEKLAQQLARSQVQQSVAIALNAELTPYPCRHAFVLRLAQQENLHLREAASLMGHSEHAHLIFYRRRLDAIKLNNTVIEKQQTRSRKQSTGQPSKSRFSTERGKQNSARLPIEKWS
jgi:site-specific recombinase XerD